MQRSSRMTSTGFWADPAKTGQLEDLVAQLVLVGMCAMLIAGLVYWALARRAHHTWHTALTDEERREMRAEYSQRLYRVLEAHARMLPLLPAGSMSSAYRKPHTCWQHHAALTGRHDLQRASTNSGPPHPIAGVLVLLGRPNNGNYDLWMRAGRGRFGPRDGASL
jgi:hypothetical protein